MSETAAATVSPTPGDTVTLPRADYKALLERLEDLEDILAASRVDETDAIPLDDYKKIAAGDVSALRYWRERRGLSQAALAEKAGVPQSYISTIEGGKKPGSVSTYKALAEALDLDVDDLI
ncbi:helix-turn-helix domain-containing protein [Roseospira marina]|uniref:Helix-turn-helix domain-containing protein n=1 Tax=Roseospira marina TaxID=140057 RepID=A0A5M6I641_9PROT|nr:helix-turn-helix transcriptional regulator [Roseospira marina]KAA5603716.1 helix-turn-helix domain-containing protein [Roseospira marina]MBB4316127.1 DNA-binding XRE family transcriptional regulator [Roseospira marina]MBB5089325.1 DNA-binding XRE family transcriptional regulator [Roseospira marina]